MNMAALPEGMVPVGAVVLVEGLTDNGSRTFLYRSTNGLTHWQVLGMLDLAQSVVHDDVFN